MVNPQGYQEQLQKDKETLKALGNMAVKAGTFVYRHSAINALTDPSDYIAAQVESAEMAKKMMDKAANMNAEDWGELTGQLAFEVLMEVGTAGGAAALTAAKIADKTVDAARLLNKVENLGDAAKAADKLEDISDGTKLLPPPKELGDIAKAGEKIQDGTKLEVPKELGDVIHKVQSPVNIGLFKRYIKNVEKLTNRKLHPKQVEKLKDALRNKKYEKLSPAENLKKRREFNSKRDDLILEWEKETKQKWPRYTEDLVNKEGKVIRKKDQAYDAHHIIENNYGGNDEWWNMHPAKFPDEHQSGIHGKGAPSREIFK